MGNVFLSLIYGLLGGVWRRGFGCDFWNIPVLKIRAVQHALAAGTLFALFYFFKNMSFFVSLYTIVVIQGVFWAGGHGAAFDMSRGGLPDDTLMRRYNAVWFAPVVNFLVPKAMWYGFGYDMLWMALRYTWPCVLLIPVFGLSVMLLGIAAALIYAVCWSLSECRELPYKLQPTQAAECIVGALVGLWWVLG